MLYFVIVPQQENAYRVTVVMRRCITVADIYWKSLGQTNYSPLLGWIFLSLAVSLPGVFFFFFCGINPFILFRSLLWESSILVACSS